MKNPVVKTMEGWYRLISTEYVFIKGNTVDRYGYKNKRLAPKARVILRSCLRPHDKIYYCARCRTLPAYQLDTCYQEGIHDFTLCKACLDEFNEKFNHKEEEE